MLKVLHKGIQPNFDLDESTLTGEVSDDVKLAYIQSLVAGKAIGLDANGKVQMADGASGPSFMGFLINDADGYFMENVPALASKKVAATFGNCVVVTDQVVDGVNFEAADDVFVGTGEEAGLLTNTDPTGTDDNGIPIGKAGKATTATDRELIVYVG